MLKKSNNIYIATMSGAIAGGLESTITWPTEYTKTLLQLQKNNKIPQYSGVIDCAKQQIRKHGPIGLYRGLAPALTFAIPKAGIRFGSYSFFQNLFGEKTPIKNLGAGMMAGAVEAILVVTPQETIKTKLIEMNSGFYNGVKSIIQTNGFRGFYNGLVPTIIKQSTNQGLRFMSFGLYKNNVLKYTNSNELTTYQALCGGMVSGCISTLFNNPIDVIKTRMQGLESKQYINTQDCVKKIIKKEGLITFYKGIGPRLMRVIPGQGIIFASYEKISHMLETIIIKKA